MLNASIKTKFGKPNVEFNHDGTLKYVEMEILNLNNQRMWEKVLVIKRKKIK